MSKRAKTALASGLGLIALSATYLVAPWEGTKNPTYWDQLGQVWTVCTGESNSKNSRERIHEPLDGVTDEIHKLNEKSNQPSRDA